MSGGILFEGHGAGRQLDPGMPAAIVDGKLRGRKAGIGKSAYGDAHAVDFPFFGVEEVGPADGAETENELCPLIAGTHIFCGVAYDLVGSSEAGQGGEDAAGSLLASKAVANADSGRLALDYYA